jgi:NADH dehydrogenase/NADH:ubiquinone oxidoreductase subunit G
LVGKSQPLSALDDAAEILCLGFGGRYAQSVVEIALHQASKRGARLISLNSQDHVFARYTDLWLRPAAGKEPELLEELAQITSGTMPGAGLSQPGALSSEERLSWEVELAGLELRQAKSLVILVGPAYLTHPRNRQLLAAIEQLAENTGGRIIALPEQGNLMGAALTGAINFAVPNLPVPQVLYLIGEDIPENLAGDPFILYQNILPPTQGHPDLVLPAVAFSEDGGSLIDHSGLVRPFNRAVLPPGEALPNWLILSRIAQTMGIAGFDYRGIDDIRAEIAGNFGQFQVGERLLPHQAGRKLEPGSEVQRDERWGAGQLGEHTYMGFPLANSVEGLKMLFPQEQDGGEHV